MDGLLSSRVLEYLDAFVSLVATGAFTVAGALAESAGLQNVLAGQPAVGLWEVWMGAVALFVGIYLLGYNRLYRRYRGRVLRS
ncbi:MAG: hypothetical protein ACOCSF_00980 [Halanaeroarchaeum sp.]